MAKKNPAKKPTGRPFTKETRPQGGRPKGVPNRTTTVLKEAILLAGETVGDELAVMDANAVAKQLRLEPHEIDLSKFSGGLPRYLVMLARNEPKTFAALLGRVLPLVVQDGGKAPDADTMARVERFTEAMEQLRERAEKRTMQ